MAPKVVKVKVREEQFRKWAALMAQHLIGEEESLVDIIATAGNILEVEQEDELSEGDENFLRCLRGANPGAGRGAIVAACLPQFLNGRFPEYRK